MAKAKRKTPKVKTIKPTKPGQKKITFHPGGLHRSTGTPLGKKIPAKKRAAALAGRYGPKAKKEALFAQNVLVGKKRKKR